MKCEEVNCVVATTHLGHTPRGAPGVGWGTSGGSRGDPTTKSARFRNKRGEMNIKRGHFWTKWPNVGAIRRKSYQIEEIPQFYHGKGNFWGTDRQTETFQLSELGYLKFRSTRIPSLNLFTS